ncbi:Synaptic vesicle transporter SVOP and related transporters (major facilitator superfamily) [Phaffia rhodozyma]|uniref:Synaptic vesicle transporter SVOP and related transporters (Major facilitator superfamily) n=1 Tax=Phaffia rhodozyma TaxID=264483 RepID=A0A0F7SKY0_PHARH|nr:Synaptic vesicle transporter SVOP and related transporters (major facilitator superfamily) [Phaffia rhodozyma]
MATENSSPSEGSVPLDLVRELESDAEKSLDLPGPHADMTHKPVDPYEVYLKFSPRRKKAITCLVSFAAFLSPLASASFFPSIPDVAESVNTTKEVINYTVAIFLLFLGSAPLIWAPLSGFYGRRNVYLASLPIFIGGSIGCSFSNTLGSLIATRCLQAIGGSAVLSVGAGTIGDIYSPIERAGAMGLFYLGAVMGPALAPLFAGLLQQYTAPGWRSTQYLLAGAGGAALVLIFFFLPETWHGPTPHMLAKQRTGKKFVMYWFNPVRSVGLLRFTNILFISLNSSLVLLTTYVLVVPITSTMQPRYGITNAAIVGLLYLPQGVGNIIGSRIGGLYADKVVRKYIDKRGYRRPEDRLYSTLLGGGIILPVSLIGAGWTIQTGAGGLAPPCVFMFSSGFGLMLVFSSANTYCVDCLQSRSAEVIAINNCMRYVFSAAGTAGILPLINKIGVGWADTWAAGLTIIGFLFVCAIIRWGERWAGRSAPEIPLDNPPSGLDGTGPIHHDEKGSRADEPNFSSVIDDRGLRRPSNFTIPVDLTGKELNSSTRDHSIIGLSTESTVAGSTFGSGKPIDVDGDEDGATDLKRKVVG